MPRRRRHAIILAAAATCAVLTGCDAGQQSAALEVKVFSVGDGRATLTLLSLDPSPTLGSESEYLDADIDADSDALAALIADRLELGTVVGRTAPLDEGPDSRGYTLAGVGTERLQVEVAVVLSIADDLGYPPTDDVFVSLCTSVTAGEASASTAEVAHLDSCAVWSSSDERASDTAVLGLRFHDRRSPATSSTIYLGVVMTLGLVAAVAATTAGHRRRRAVAGIVAGVAMFVAAGIGVLSLVWSVRLADPLPDTGQVFDTDLAGGSRTMAVLSVVLGVMLPGAVLGAGRWFSRRWRV